MNKYKEIITYVIFGGLTTLVNWIIYIGSTLVFGLGMTMSNAAAWIGAVVFAFVTNKLIVFQSKDLSIKNVFREIVLFFASRIVSGGIEIFLPTLLVRVGLTQTLFNIKGLGAKLIVSVVVIVLNYIMSKVLVFKNAGNNGGSRFA